MNIISLSKGCEQTPIICFDNLDIVNNQMPKKEALGEYSNSNQMSIITRTLVL